MRRCLLIANSDGATCGLYESYFSSAGYRVETVSDGMACMNRLRESCPDLLLLDSQLPWGGGEGVLTVLREDKSFARLPVVLFADFIPIQEMSRLLIRPVIRCLEKRCTVQTLRYCVDSALALRDVRRSYYR
jgi:DNA-binding NtrC family response regulator